MPNEPKFEDIVGEGVCPDCGWTLTLHGPSCMVDVPAVEYVLDGDTLVHRESGRVVGGGEDVPPAA